MISKDKLDLINSFDDPEELLDELVHEAKAEEAASINNEGIESQVEFLVAEAGWFSSVDNLIEYLENSIGRK